MKLVVVGGVAAGASTAAGARRLDESAEIIVFERGHHVSFHAGTKANIIAERAELQINIRSYSEPVRTALLAAIRRIVTAGCAASNCPREPDFEMFDRAPLTDNDPEFTARVTGAFTEALGDDVMIAPPRVFGSEDFSDIANVVHAPYSYWLFGGTDRRPISAPRRWPDWPDSRYRKSSRRHDPEATVEVCCGRSWAGAREAAPITAGPPSCDGSAPPAQRPPPRRGSAARTCQHPRRLGCTGAGARRNSAAGQRFSPQDR